MQIGMYFDIGHKFELANEFNEPNCRKGAEHRPQHSDEGLGGCRGTEQRTAQRKSERYSFHYYFCPVRDLAPTRLTIIFPAREPPRNQPRNQPRKPVLEINPHSIGGVPGYQQRTIAEILGEGRGKIYKRPFFNGFAAG
jgi:hypothetical protein